MPRTRAHALTNKGQRRDPVELTRQMKPVPRLGPATPLRATRRRRVLTDLARIFSTICNPFVTALFLFVIIAHEKATSTSSFWVLLFTSTIFTSIGPMFYVLWLYATDRIADLDMSVRSEREKVFGIFVVFYALGTAVLWFVHAPALMTASMAGYTAASLITQYITRYWKISTHAIGITAPLVVLIYLYGEEPLPFLVLIPLVGWSRVWLGAHTVAQVVAGASVLFFFRVFHLI
jgi:membrane-associated phospholipid phosphatase